MKEKKAIKKPDSIIPQAKLLRLFQIIGVLKTGPWTIKQLAERFDMSERSVYRYLTLIEEVNFMLEKDFQNRYFIITSEDDPSHSQFSIEETQLIKKIIEVSVTNNPLRNSLLKKLSLNSEIDSMPKLFVKGRLTRFIEQLSEAIKLKKQVVLKQYHSANSNDIRDRLIEPIHFGDNYQSIMALDVQDKVCKQFKLDRIAEIILFNTSFEFESLHKKNNTDMFGFTGDASLWVTLKLSLRAYLLLREEHPLSISYTEKHETFYQFHGPVSSFEGIGRFILGLIDEIEIHQPASLKEYINAKVNAKK